MMCVEVLLVGPGAWAKIHHPSAPWSEHHQQTWLPDARPSSPSSNPPLLERMKQIIKFYFHHICHFLV